MKGDRRLDQGTENLNEELLDAWLGLSTTLWNERVVSDMPYKEALVCNILYRNQKKNPGKKLTATDLCEATKMLKSQMNRTLNSMEEKNLIKRERSSIDKRQVYISLDLEHAVVYREQHKKILQLVDVIIDKFGREKTLETIKLVRTISNIIEEVIQ